MRVIGSDVIAQYQVELGNLPFGRIPALSPGIPAKAGLTLSLNSMIFHLILSNYVQITSWFCFYVALCVIQRRQILLT